MRIFLADLGHNQLTVSSDAYPLGIANLASYAASRPSSPNVSFRLFREPQDLKAAIDEDPPDVLGLSSYAWNHELSLAFARYAKERAPRTINLLGGPNFPLTDDEQERFLRGLPDIDLAVRGPTYEAERAFSNVVERLVRSGASAEALREEPIAGSLWIHPRDGAFVRGSEVDRIRDLDEIPSPYLAGLLDPFFATGYFPLLQIARGCPFSCAFCNSAVASNSKIFAHSVENVKADLLYIAERVKPEATLCFADDNFGMYPRDEEIADYLAYLQDRYQWPRYIRTTTGKNKHERIIRVMRKIRGSLPMTAAVQSMDPVVLENIERSNIHLDSYAAIQTELEAQGMQAYGELILCLPGETRESFLRAVRDLLATGVQRVSAHQLMLLHGAPISNPESRRRWSFDTRFRVVARNVGDYTGAPVIEVEEMVVATPTLTFEDYFELRVFHLLLTIFFYEGNFAEAFALARGRGISAFDLIVRMASLLDRAPRGFRTLVGDFVRESREELFPTREACIAWGRVNFAGLVEGRVGGNLLSKYSMLGRFYSTEESLDLLERTIESASGDGDPEELRAVIDHLRAVLLRAPFADSLAHQPEWTSSYDVAAWAQSGYAAALEQHRIPGGRRFVARIEPERRALITSRLATFGEHVAGLGRFTRSLFARDLRRSIVDCEPPYTGARENLS